MNQGRIWCVVHPTVGLPLLLGSVAITSLIVHASVMTHTTWMGNYWQGAAKPKLSMENASPPVATADSKAQPAFSMMVTPVPATAANGQASFMITVTPNTAATVNTETAADTATIESPAAAPIHAASLK